MTQSLTESPSVTERLLPRPVAFGVIGLTTAAFVAAIVLLFVGNARSGAWFSAGDDVPSADSRARAVATAEQFCLRVDGFDGDDPDGYAESVTALLTTKYKADFEKEFEQIKQTGLQKGQKGEGEILASGIQTIDDDSASVLVVHDNTITSAAGTGKQHSRWIVSLDKVGGRWLVDDFRPVS